MILTIEAETAAEMREKIRDLAEAFGVVEKPPQLNLFSSAPQVMNQDPPAPPETKPGVTLDEVNALVKKVYDTKGADAAKEIIVRFGVQNVRGLKPADYREVVALCQSALT